MASQTPVRFATNSHARLCHAAIARTGCASERDTTEVSAITGWAATSEGGNATAARPAPEIRSLADFAIAHLHQAVAALRQPAVVGCHHQGDAFGGGQFQQQVENLEAGALIE